MFFAIQLNTQGCVVIQYNHEKVLHSSHNNGFMEAIFFNCYKKKPTFAFNILMWLLQQDEEYR